jgi:hypothetical protein
MRRRYGVMFRPTLRAHRFRLFCIVEKPMVADELAAAPCVIPPLSSSRAMRLKTSREKIVRYFG